MILFFINRISRLSLLLASFLLTTSLFITFIYGIKGILMRI